MLGLIIAVSILGLWVLSFILILIVAIVFDVDDECWENVAIIFALAPAFLFCVCFISKKRLKRKKEEKTFKIIKESEK